MSDFYPEGREAWGNAEVDWLDDDIVVIGVGAGYTYDAADAFVSDLADTIFTSDPLTGKTNNGGIFDADDVTILAVPGGDTVTQVIVAKDTGVAGTSRLLLYFDQNSSAVSISLSTTGADVLVRWSNGTNKIAKL